MRERNIQRSILPFVVAGGLAGLGACATGVSRVGAEPTALIGTWELVSRFDRTADGRTTAEPSLGGDPLALLIYDRNGHVAAQLMRRDRTSATRAVSATPSADPNNSGAVGGYDAYFGTYTIDAAAGTVTHRLQGALVPSDVGRVLTRRFRVRGDTLTIDFDARGPSAEPVVRTLVWRRAG